MKTQILTILIVLVFFSLKIMEKEPIKSFELLVIFGLFGILFELTEGKGNDRD